MAEHKEFEEMRRKDRLLGSGETEAILKNAEYGILATVCEDGYPYALPISFVYEDGRLYFHHSISGGQLGRNLKPGSKACFTTVGNTEVLSSQFATLYESVIAFGRVCECGEKIPALMKIIAKYSPEFLEAGQIYAEKAMDKVQIYEMTIDHVTGKARKNR